MSIEKSTSCRMARAEEFLTFQRYEAGASPHTISSYRYDLAKLDRFLPPDRDWPDVTRADLRAFLQELHVQDYAIKSVRRIIAAVRSFYRYLRLEGLVEHAAVNDLPRMKVPAVLPRYLDWDDVERLLGAVLGPLQRNQTHPTDIAAQQRNYALLVTMAATGIRISEVVGLRLGDVNLVNSPQVRVLGKGQKERVVPLHPDATVILQRYIDLYRKKLHPKADWVFVGRTGKPLSRRALQRQIQRYAETAGITQRVTPHTFRHSFATAMASAGMPLPVLQELLGHASIQTTAIYTHVSIEHLRQSYMTYHPASARRREIA